MSRLTRQGLAVAVTALGLLANAAGAVAPVLIQSAPGRFEISAVDPTVAHSVAAAAEEGWRLLAAPLSLPDSFPSPVFVRIGPPAAEEDRSPFRVIVEIGGIVSVRLRGDAATPGLTRRALVQGLLMRLAVAHHGVTERLSVPLWLEHACAGWWETRSNPARLDALKFVSAKQGPPPIETLLGWQRGSSEPEANAMASTWLLTFFQAESGRPGEWPMLLLRLLRGDDPLIAVTSSFPGRYGSAAEREMWWQTGYHHLRRIRTLPVLDAGDSHQQLEDLARFVFADSTGDADVVVPLSIAVARAAQPVVTSELTRRAGELSRLLPGLHPFYRNAGLSLGEVFASRSLPAAKRNAATAAFEKDWDDAVELQAATRAALDGLERNSAPAR